jgi:peptidoglycan/LPS O-acetylase OafA/YrhL
VRYAPQLDGLRAICVALTIANHIGPTAWYINGTLGVDVFFALSGFLITSLLIGERHASGGTCIRCFYTRRFFRIAPLYYFTIALYAASTYFLFSQGLDLVRFPQMKAAAPYVLIFLGEYRPDSAGTLLGHTWTLGIEEKYYLLWPLIFITTERLSHVSRVWLLTLIVAFCWLFLPEELARGYGGLAIGSLLAILCADEASRVRTALVFTPTFIIVLGLAFCYTASLLTHNSLAAHFSLTTVAGLFVVNVVHRRSLIRKVLSSAIFVFIGKRTYGIYLLHVLFANGLIELLKYLRLDVDWKLRFALAFLGSIVIASIVKILLEDPMMDVGRKLSKRMMGLPNAVDVA